MNPLSGAMPLSYVHMRHIRGALVAHGHTFTPPRCRTSQYCRTIVRLCLSVTLWNYLHDPVLDGVGLVGFKSKTYTLLLD